jgi:hypothetical protein
MNAALSEADVQVELWRSFSSLLKAYAAAASLNGTEHHVPDLDEEDLQIRAGSRILDILYHAPTQRGQWSIVSDGVREHGVFQLTSEGSIVLEGATLNMDHGAIELIAKLTESAGASL